MKEKKESKFWQIVMIIMCVILIALVLMNTVLIVKSYTNPDNIPSAFGISPMIVLSGSMSPTFETGALIFIKDIDASTLEVGDVICYMTQDVAVTHRIVSIQDVGGTLAFATQGDANNIADVAVVYESQIEGKYFAHIAGLGTVALFMQSTVGIIVCVAIPILLYLVWDTIKRKSDTKNEKEKNAKLQAELAKFRSENPPQE